MIYDSLSSCAIKKIILLQNWSRDAFNIVVYPFAITGNFIRLSRKSIANAFLYLLLRTCWFYGQKKSMNVWAFSNFINIPSPDWEQFILIVLLRNISWYHSSEIWNEHKKLILEWSSNRRPSIFDYTSIKIMVLPSARFRER